MSYYQISYPTSKKQIGHYPQIIPANGGHLKIRHDIITETDPDLELKIHQYAKQTDLIDRNTLGIGLIVSDSFKALLKQFHLPNHRFYPLRFRSLHPMTVNYTLFHFYDDIFLYVDFTQSTFELYHKIEMRQLDKVRVNSKEEYLDKCHKQTWDIGFRATNIVLKENFPNYDIFDTHTLTPLNYLISERLAHSIIEHKLTGVIVSKFEFREFPIK